MSSKKYLLLFALIACSVLAGISATPCPFSNLCDCVEDPSEKGSFVRVDCTSETGAIPDFTAPANTTYTVNGPMYLAYDVAKLKPKHLSVFNKIKELWMRQRKGSSPVYQQWDETAFDGVTIETLNVNGLAGMVPLPKPLQKVTVPELSIQDQGVPYTLEDKTFDNQRSLRSLELSGSNITKISDQIFVNLDNLATLLLNGSGLTEVPAKALLYYAGDTGTPFKRTLTTVGLEDNNIQSVQSKDFGNFPSLYFVNLGSNPITNIAPNAFFGSTKLEAISLFETTIKNLDLAAFANVSSDLNVMFPFAHDLTGLTVSSFDNFPDRAVIDLTTSSLQTVDPKVGDLLDKYPNASIDMSSLENFHCKNVDWMVKSVLCTKSLKVRVVRCIDRDMWLEDYLKSVSPPDPCKGWPTSAAPTAAPATTAPPPTQTVVNPTTNAPIVSTSQHSSGWGLNQDTILRRSQVLLLAILAALLFA